MLSIEPVFGPAFFIHRFVKTYSITTLYYLLRQYSYKLHQPIFESLHLNHENQGDHNRCHRHGR